MKHLLNAFLRPFERRLRKITLIGQEREGGYIFLTSPDLKGFSFMLEPHERDLKAILAAMDEPLQTYMEAQSAYEAPPQKRRRPDVTGMRITQINPMNIEAELCRA